MIIGLGLGLQYIRRLINRLSVLVQSIIDSLKSRGTIVENIEGTTTELVALEEDGLLSKASILITPTSVSAGLIHAAIPINGDCDLTVVRANDTATRVNELGLIESVPANVARLDFTDPLNPSILVEPQRTNAFPFHADTLSSFTKGVNAGNSISYVINGALSPRGDMSASVVSMSAVSSSFAQYYLSGLITPNVVQTFSVYLKGVLGGERVYLMYTATGASWDSVECILTTEWKRFSYVFTPTSYKHLQIGTDLRDPAQTSTPAQSFHLWGGQLEEGSYPTSIIPTNGTALTRNADAIGKTGISSYINSIEGVLFVEVKPSFDESLQHISLSAGVNDSLNYISIQFNENFIAFQTRTTINGYVAFSTPNIYPDLIIKIAFKYKDNDNSFWINGIKVGSLNAVTLPFNTPLQVVELTRAESNVLRFYGEVKNLQVYSTALTDQELITLTTQ